MQEIGSLRGGEGICSRGIFSGAYGTITNTIETFWISLDQKLEYLNFSSYCHEGTMSCVQSWLFHLGKSVQSYSKMH